MGKSSGDSSDRPPRMLDELEAVKAERRANIRLAGQLAGGAAVGGAIGEVKQRIEHDEPPKDEHPDDSRQEHGASAAGDDGSTDVSHDLGSPGTYYYEGIYAWSSTEHDADAFEQEPHTDSSDLDDSGTDSSHV